MHVCVLLLFISFLLQTSSFFTAQSHCYDTVKINKYDAVFSLLQDVTGLSFDMYLTLRRG